MSEEQDDRGELVLIGGLWLHKDHEGRHFLSGSLGIAQLFVFKNKFKKEGDKYPDYRIYVARRPKPDATDALANSDADALAPAVDQGNGATDPNGKDDAPPF